MPTDRLVLVPLRSFADAKTRLTGALDAAERSSLAEQLAERVLGALHRWDVAIVTDDDEVATWATDRGVEVIRPDVAGLNPSVTVAVAAVHDRGIGQVAVVHADLARPDALDDLLSAATAPDRVAAVTAVPDRHGLGTNVLVVPTGIGFRFGYGPTSFARHRTEAARLGLRFVEAPHPELGWDVDTPEDLDHRPERP